MAQGRLARVLLGGVAVAALGCGGALAADDRAVSAPVLTVDGSAGSIGGSASGFFGATGTVPVGDHFGAQLDLSLGQSDARGQGGTAGHFFARDPAAGLIGATAMWSRIGGWNVYRYGVEGEAYLGDFTVAPSGGVQRGDANQGTTGYGTLDLSWYTTPDLKLSVGGTGFSNFRTGFAGVEWQPDQSMPLSLFANAGAGNRGPGFALAGLRFAFGAGSSSLKDRNRHGDPENIVSFINATGGGSLGASAQAIATSTTQTTPSGGGGGGGGGCFIAGTLVLMADGLVKIIETVAVGDLLRGADGATNRVETLIRPLLGDQSLYAVNNGSAFVTDDHPFMTAAGWKAINPAAAEKTNPGLVVGALAAGDVLITADGEVSIRAIDAHRAPVGTQLFNFSVSGNRTFFVRPAGGEPNSSPTTNDQNSQFLLVHNKD